MENVAIRLHWGLLNIVHSTLLTSQRGHSSAKVAPVWDQMLRQLENSAALLLAESAHSVNDNAALDTAWPNLPTTSLHGSPSELNRADFASGVYLNQRAVVI